MKLFSLFKIHLNILLFFTVISLPISIVFIEYRIIYTPIILGITLLNNLFFCTFFLKKLSKRYFLLGLLVLVLISLLLGVLYNENSRRTITDFFVPTVFILKIFISINLFQKVRYYEYFLKFLDKFIRYNLFAAIISIFIFYIIFSYQDIKYLGLTPLLTGFVVDSLIKNRLPLVILALFLLFMSGKRALIVSNISIILAWFVFYSKFLFTKKNIVYLLLLIMLTIYFNPIGELDDFKAYQKYEYTVNELASFQSTEDLDQASGGRVAEIVSIINDNNWYDYIFGRGVGYTYSLYSNGVLIDSEYSNAHLSPLSIISKYGLFFFLLLYGIIFKTILSKGRDYLTIFSKLYIFAILIESLFSYTLLMERLLPFLMGWQLINNASKEKFINRNMNNNIINSR